MTSLEPKDLILEIIARLRNRKARPDLEKITHMADRKYGLVKGETEDMLNKLVHDGIVNKVTYKGRTSYRNAAKCSKSRSSTDILNRKASAKLRDAIQSLISTTSDNSGGSGSCFTSSTATGGASGGRANNNNNNNTNNKNQQKIVNDTNNNEEETCTGGRNNNNNNSNSNSNSNSSGGQDEAQLKLVSGVSLSQIESWWREQSFDAALSKVDLNTLLTIEIAARRIQTLPNGNYISCRGGGGAGGSGAVPRVHHPSSSSSSKKDKTTTTPAEGGHQPPTPPLSSEKQRPEASSASNKKGDPGCNNNSNSTTTTTQQQQKSSSDNRIIPSSTNNKPPATNKTNSCPPKPPCKRGRPASKRKKFLKNHGPDFHAEIPVAIHGIDKCDYCLQPADPTPNGQNDEPLLFCTDCSSKAHPSCMNYSPELALRAQHSSWQCTNCKVCNICQDSGYCDGMFICDLCDQGYHVHCLAPSSNKKPTGVLAVVGNWVCSECDKIKQEEMSPESLMDTEDVDTKGNCLYEPPTPCESPELPAMHFSSADNFGDVQKRRSVYDGPYPNVTNFSVEDIVQFFKSKGFGKESTAFSEQEIDGKSLLLMKRDDVLMGLRAYICLGPALKIFKHVERLQWASE